MNLSTLSLSSRLILLTRRAPSLHKATSLSELSKLSRAFVTSSHCQRSGFAQRHAPHYSRQYSVLPKGNVPEVDNEIRENIYTIPNALTVSRILACPILGWAIVQGKFGLATGILVYAGVSDWVCNLQWMYLHARSSFSEGRRLFG